MAAVIQTFGSSLKWSPGIHAIVTHAVFIDDGSRPPIPFVDSPSRHKVPGLPRDRDLIGSRCTARSISAQLGGEKAADVRSARARERQCRTTSATSSETPARPVISAGGSWAAEAALRTAPRRRAHSRLHVRNRKDSRQAIDQELRSRGRRGSLPLQQVGELHHQLAVLPSENVGW
jgi:hypothetical protein